MDGALQGNELLQISKLSVFTSCSQCCKGAEFLYTDFPSEILLCQLRLPVYGCCWINYLPQLRGRNWNISWENHRASRLPHLRSPQRTIWWFVWKDFVHSKSYFSLHWNFKAFFCLNVELKANFSFAWERTIDGRERSITRGFGDDCQMSLW